MLGICIYAKLNKSVTHTCFCPLAVAFHRCYVLNSTPCFVSLACLMEDFWKVDKFCSVVSQNTVLVGPCHHGTARPQVADRGTASDKEGSCE